MKNNNLNDMTTKEPAEKSPRDDTIPYIKRVVDGIEYTVMIHFHPGSRETAKQKIMRLLKKEALNRDFSG